MEKNHHSTWIAVSLLLLAVIFLSHCAFFLGDNSSDLEGEMFLLIQAHREAMGLSELKWNDVLADEARSHSENMAINRVPFGHAGFEERKKNIKACIPYSRITEFVGWVSDPYGISSPATTMLEAWLDSPERKNAVEGSYDCIGVGTAKNGATYYFTVIFLKEK